MFDEEYLDSLPNEPLLALREIVNKTTEYWNNSIPFQEYLELDFFLEAYAIANVLIEHVPEVEIKKRDISGTPQDAVTSINSYFNELKSNIESHLVLLKSAMFFTKYQAKFGNTFSYEFSDGDLHKVQELVSQLRESIVSSTLFEEGHKARLLARVEKVQSELHKKMADLDRFWGLVGDAGVAIGKFGKDAKPFVDRIREISDIVWRTQSRAEELPSNTPMDLLSSPEEEA